MKEVNYKSLLKWRLGFNYTDQWYVSIDGTNSEEIFTLDQIKHMNENLQDSSDFVMNQKQAEFQDAEWFLYEDDDDGTVTCAWVFAFVVPIVGIIMAITFYAHPHRKKHATNILVTSIFMQILLIVGGTLLEIYLL